MTYYSAEYFNRSRQILKNMPPKPVTMQVFQKQESVLCGIEEAVECIRTHARGEVEIRSLSDGDAISPWETVMTIRGNLHDFVDIESQYLGILARSTRVASNMRRVVDAAKGKPVIFMGDRFDRYTNQYFDGYAAAVGGASSVVTPAMSDGARLAHERLGYTTANYQAAGTMPHALIAAHDGDVVAACHSFKNTFPDVPLTALVDFNNDCVLDTLRCIREFGDDLHAVRLDTSENMVDVSLADAMIEAPHFFGDFKATGVNPALVRAVRRALDINDGLHVKIIVSGGFTPEKITDFENNSVPVDVYGVGSSIVKNGPDFTADVVEPVSKAGRRLRDESRLTVR